MLAVTTESERARAGRDETDILDLVLWHEREIGRLLSAIDEHEQALVIDLRPALASRHDEIAGAERRLASIREQQAMAAQLEAVTSSWSWRALAPARWLFARFRPSPRAKGDRA
jgi:hypothetical protein